MGLFHTVKPKSAGKIMISQGKMLSEIVSTTLHHMSAMAGATLGPGGRQVLIERNEMNLKPIITKDGVTVIKNLGYSDPVRQLILESARDAALRTAQEAGDGTTTATILSSSITEHTQKIVSKYPKLSPQNIVREMKKMMPTIKDIIKQHTLDINGENFEEILMEVATLSANGDAELAKKVIEAFNIVGDEGNLTIIEATGESRYEVERISGYTVDIGYEESCKKFSNTFINDRSGTLVKLNKPIFLLYDGIINDTMQVFDGLQKISEYFEKNNIIDKNVVIVAHGFGDAVLGDLSVNWVHEKTINVFPLLTPQAAILNWKTNFLYDLQAYTGAPVYNPTDKPITDLNVESLIKNNLVSEFESSRFRSSIISNEDPDLIEARVEELKLQLKNPESEYEANDLNVRIGKLTSGIARLTIFAPSQGESREKRDRAEDSWMSIRGAINFGAVPGGGYILVRLAAYFLVLSDKMISIASKAAALILSNAFLKPVEILYKNYGYSDEEIFVFKEEILKSDDRIFDIDKQKWVKKHQLLDSVPAIIEAIDSSLSIASLLGTLGGVVSFSRDEGTDIAEAKSAQEFANTLLNN